MWWASSYLEHKTPDDVRALLADPAVRFDYYCWDLYARTSAYYKEDAEALKWRSATLHSIEAGVGDAAELAHLVADAIVRAHLATMARIDVEYDVLPRESEILHLKFWASAFEQLKERKAIYLETEGKNSGCWVMPGLLAKRQSDRAVRWHGDLRGQRHRLPALEIRLARQGFFLPAVSDLSGRAHAVDHHR